MAEAENALQAKEAQSSQEAQSGTEPNSADPHAGLKALVARASAPASAPTPAVSAPSSDAAPEGPTPRELRYNQSKSPSVTTQPAAAPAPQAVIPPGSPWHDPVSPILNADPSITNGQREMLWDHYMQSPDAATLAQKLTPLPISDNLKHKLWTSKQAQAAPIAPVEKVTAVMQKMADLEAATPGFLDQVEKFPTVLKALTSAKD